MKRETYIHKCIEGANYLIGKKAPTITEWNIFRFGRDFLDTCSDASIKEIYVSIRDRKKASIKYFKK